MLVHGRPVFFTQTRPGLQGNPFTFYKFRTMTQEKNEKGELLLDKDRITKFGSFLRKTSLDELPSLWNVLKGDMSLVGPRPLVMKYIPYFREHEHRRFYVKPGITGLAQISGRNKLPWDERLQLDVDYVENLSLGNDLIILLKTFLKIFSLKDVAVNSYDVEPDLDEERMDDFKNARV